MLAKPTECCECGTYEHQILIPVNNKVVAVDYCISGIVAGLNAAGIKTTGSCCGHGHTPATVILEDGRWIVVAESEAAFHALQNSYAHARGRS